MVRARNAKIVKVLGKLGTQQTETRRSFFHLCNQGRARRRPCRIEHDGNPLDPAAKYKVAANDFMFAGGDGYVTLSRGRTLVGKTDGRLLADIVMSHIRSLGVIDGKTEGRLVFQ